MRHVHTFITCEHAGNQIPKPYEHLFHDKQVLSTHRGIDLGAHAFAKQLSDGLRIKLFETHISRLLVDCNRSVNNPQVFSEFASPLKSAEKNMVLQKYYYHYRNAVESYIRQQLLKKPVLHISMHTFTPVWEGVERKIDVALLFDENRALENDLCISWFRKLKEELPDFDVLTNVPYKGADDGFTTYLREKFPSQGYMGVEIEINQKWADTQQGEKFVSALQSTLEKTLEKQLETIQ
ncbi:N-formylglutamate amidohydrolase [Ekhidna sp.]|uniref:N-formylglutamate amidohydrolase n=1 Tax=Ekhidna sp. TaxID=2608089 RepID=UPI003C7E7BB8